MARRHYRPPEALAVIESVTGGGIVVDYTPPSSSDSVDPSPEVSCTPPRGALFQLGTTTVTCTATDDAGHESSASFAVIVLTPAEAVLAMLEDIEANVGDRSVAATLHQIARLLQDGNTSNDGAVCNKLEAFINIVQQKRDQNKLSVEEADSLIAQAYEIMARLMCE